MDSTPAIVREHLARRASAALAGVAAVASSASFLFWQVFHRDVPAGIGNLRGTALALLAFALPTLLVSIVLAGRGSQRARIVWLAALAYIAYNAVMFCFASHFNSYFLLFTSLLALSFWALVTLLRSLDLDVIEAASTRVPVRVVALYLLVCMVFFSLAWLREIVPAVLNDETPAAIAQAGLTQNTVWVLDFGFTFPLMAMGAVWLWRRRPWGYVIGGMMVIMLTMETAGIALDQTFGHLHDPAAPLATVPLMIGFTAVGLAFSALFLRGMSRG